MAKAIRLGLGILFIPVAIGYSIAFYEQLLAIRKVGTPELSLLFGITGYLAFHALVTRPERAYVFGHELMHALATWVSGGKIKGFKVGSKGGSVTTDRISWLIALAPYLVPVYSVLWALGFGVAILVWNVRPLAEWFFFGLGATLAFHLVFTVHVLKEKQSDLDRVGPLLGLGLIFWTNVTLVVGVISWLVPEVRFWPYLAGGFEQTRNLYAAIFTQLFS